MAKPHLGMAIGARRQVDGYLADLQTAQVEQRKAFEEEFVLATLDAVEQCARNTIETVEAKPAAGVEGQPQQGGGQEMAQVRKEPAIRVPPLKTGLPLEPRSHDDVVMLLQLEQPGNVLGFVREIRIERDQESVAF